MNYNDALNYIHSAPKITKKPGNEALSAALNNFSNPHRMLKYIHIAGTNGKGSTSAMTDAVLRCAGYTVGLFTSPYIERFNERIKINGVDISDEELAIYTSKVKKSLEEHSLQLPEFSIIFMIAILFFANNNCDVVILETGLGGRLDATNIIEENLACAITSIGLDHVQYLGDTIEKIAFEKAGIIKKNSNVILYPSPSEDVLDVVSCQAKRLDAHLTIAQNPIVLNQKRFLYKDMEYLLSLDGKYQFSNAAVCLEIIKVLENKGYIISNNNVKDGLKSVNWPGRFEWLNQRLIIDGCHNEEGAEKFAEAVKDISEHITIVTGVMRDKDCNAIAAIFSKITDDIIVTNVNDLRALHPNEYKNIFAKFGVSAKVIEDPETAVNTALNKDGICAVCGSLYLVGEIRNKFKSQIT